MAFKARRPDRTTWSDTLRLLLIANRHSSNLNMNSLLLAVKANDVEAIQRLLTYSPSCRKLVNYQAPNNHETPLFVACVRGYTGVVRWLLNRGARVDVTTSWGATALHAAAERGHDTTIKLLLERKAPIQAQTQYGDTALHLAAFRGHHRVVILLLAAGINTTITNSKGRTAVDEAEVAGHRIISKHLRYQRQSNKISNVEGDESCTPMHTKPLPTAAQMSFSQPDGQSWSPPCSPPRHHGCNVENYLLPTSTTAATISVNAAQHQARVHDWVIQSTIPPRKTSSMIKVGHVTADEAAPEVFAAPFLTMDNYTCSKGQPMSHARRKISKLRDIGKSHSCEGLCTQTDLPDVTSRCDLNAPMTPYVRCRRVNSL